MINVLSNYSDDLSVVAKVEDQLPAEKANLAFHSYYLTGEKTIGLA